MTITRERQEFGCPVFFEDRVEDENTKDVAIDCFSFEDSAYSVTKKERNIGIQVYLNILMNFLDNKLLAVWKLLKTTITTVRGGSFG